MRLVPLHASEEHDQLLFDDILAGMDLRQDRIERPLVHALGFEPGERSQSDFRAQLAPQFAGAASGTVAHTLSLGRIGEPVTGPAEEQPAGAIEVLATLSAPRTEEQRRLTALGARQAKDTDRLLGWLPFPAISSVAEVEDEEPVSKRSADPIGFAIIALPVQATEIALPKHAPAAHQAGINTPMVFDRTGMLCVPAAASEPAHHASLPGFVEIGWQMQVFAPSGTHRTRFPVSLTGNPEVHRDNWENQSHVSLVAWKVISDSLPYEA